MNPLYGDLVLMDAFYWLRYTPARLLALIVFVITNQNLGTRPHLKTKATNYSFFFLKKIGPAKVKLDTGAHI